MRERPGANLLRNTPLTGSAVRPERRGLCGQGAGEWGSAERRLSGRGAGSLQGEALQTGGSAGPAWDTGRVRGRPAAAPGGWSSSRLWAGLYCVPDWPSVPEETVALTSPPHSKVRLFGNRHLRSLNLFPKEPRSSARVKTPRQQRDPDHCLSQLHFKGRTKRPKLGRKARHQAELSLSASRGKAEPGWNETQSQVTNKPLEQTVKHRAGRDEQALAACSRQRWAEARPGEELCCGRLLLRIRVCQRTTSNSLHPRHPHAGPGEACGWGRSQASAELPAEHALLCNRRAILGPVHRKGPRAPLTARLHVQNLP